jgi:hypothetical protein
MKYNQPFDQPSNPNAAYIDGNPSAGIQGSIVPAAAVEYPQREIMNAITAVALGGTNSDLTQLLQMLKIMDVNNKFKWATNIGNASQWSASIPSMPIMPPPAGTAIWFKPAYDSVKGGTVFSVNGSAFMPVMNPNLTPVDLGDVVPASVILLFFDGTEWLIIAGKPGNTSGGPTSGGSIPSLQKNVNWYVNGTTGDDTNYDGTSATVVSAKVGPFKTIQRASDEVLKYNMNGYNQSINIADGTYTGPVSLRPLNGSGQVGIQGNTANPQNVTVQIPAGSNLYSCFFQTGGYYIYNGIRCTTGAGQLDGISSNGGIAILANVRFGPCARYHISSGDSGSSMFLQGGTITIESGANAVSHMNAQLSGLLSFPAAFPSSWPSLNVLGPVSFSAGFIGALALGIAQMKYTTITGGGNISGPKWYAQANGIIDSYGGGVSYFPGTVAGSASSGGQYYT